MSNSTNLMAVPIYRGPPKFNLFCKELKITTRSNLIIVFQLKGIFFNPKLNRVKSLRKLNYVRFHHNIDLLCVYSIIYLVF